MKKCAPVLRDGRDDDLGICFEGLRGVLERIPAANKSVNQASEDRQQASPSASQQ